MAEWSIAHAWKACVVKSNREFESLSLRHYTWYFLIFPIFMAFPDYLYEKIRKILFSEISFAENFPSHNSLQEKWLYSIWSHQRIRRNVLHTLTGDSLAILHPGFRSLEAGPDFRNALIRIGNNPPLQCDIEIDLEPSGHRRLP